MSSCSVSILIKELNDRPELKIELEPMIDGLLEEIKLDLSMRSNKLLVEAKKRRHIKMPTTACKINDVVFTVKIKLFRFELVIYDE